MQYPAKTRLPPSMRCAWVQEKTIFQTLAEMMTQQVDQRYLPIIVACTNVPHALKDGHKQESVEHTGVTHKCPRYMDSSKHSIQ